MASQWERLLKNTGTWAGSFTQLSPAAEVLGDTPTEVALLPQEGNALMRQEIRRQPPGEAPQETVLEYRSLGKGVLFSPTGAFSQGSIQWSPFGDFGAELGLIHQSERLRLVPLFKGERQLSSLTLIREHLAGTAPVDRPTTTLEQLVGTWRGEATSTYPDLRPETHSQTQLVLTQQGNQVQQSLSFGAAPIISQGQVSGSRIGFEQGSQPVTVQLLPGGASVTYPSQISPGKPLFLEAGWLIQPDLRQRLIRAYDAQGTWSSLTLVVERKIA